MKYYVSRSMSNDRLWLYPGESSVTVGIYLNKGGRLVKWKQTLTYIDNENTGDAKIEKNIKIKGIERLVSSEGEDIKESLITEIRRLCRNDEVFILISYDEWKNIVKKGGGLGNLGLEQKRQNFLNAIYIKVKTSLALR